MALPIGLAVGTGATLLGGLLSASGQKVASQYASAATLLQGQAQSFTYSYNATATRREAESLRKSYERETQAFDQTMKQQIENIKFQFAQQGISTTSGSGLDAINSLVTESSLQRKFIGEAQSEDELNVMLTALNYDHMARMSTLTSEYTAKFQRLGGTSAANLTILGSAVQAGGNLAFFSSGGYNG